MDPVYLFSLASKRNEWLTNRQTVVAENIANANTPGYEAKDITSFADVLDRTALGMRATSPMHLAGLASGERGAGIVEEDSWGVTHSGNSVSLEQEMLKASEISQGYALDTSIMKAFHRMLITTVKG